MHHLLARGALTSRLARMIERRPRVAAWFTTVERISKERLFGCRMCGQCALPVTGYACPMTCPKELRNGPCGGVAADGGCEVHPETTCVWILAHDRAAQAGRVADLARLQRPVDHRRWGESAWLNHWQGRDDGLWTEPVGPDTTERRSILRRELGLTPVGPR
jgi:hypothetical protein